MKFEIVTSKSKISEFETPASLHKVNCGGAKREASESFGSIIALNAETLEAARKEGFVESGLEESGWVLEDLKVHSCYKGK